MMITKPFKTYIHGNPKRMIVISNSKKNDSTQPKVHNPTMSTLLRKMKVAFDKANEVCSADNYTDDECLFSWNELDELVDHYKLLSKKTNMPMNKKIVNNNDWDVIH